MGEQSPIFFTLMWYKNITTNKEGTINSILVVNAISLNMIASSVLKGLISFAKMTAADAAEWLRNNSFRRALGHADVCAIASKELGVELAFNRESVKLEAKLDRLLVVQYEGPRLAEGCATLPEGAKIRYFAVVVWDPENVPDLVLNEDAKSW